jgi:dihydrofolate synthase/folylpolyglutamate synthase
LFDFRSTGALPDVEISGLQTSMIGGHQQSNAALAIAACLELTARGWPISHESIRLGLREAWLAGRCEPVCTSPFVVLDIAHNEAAARALAQSLSHDLTQFANAENKVLLFAASKDKDVAAIARPLAGLFDRIVVTRYQDNPRGLDPAVAFKLFSQILASHSHNTILEIEPNPIGALDKIWAGVTDRDAICVTGSAFLVAEIRPRFLKLKGKH